MNKQRDSKNLRKDMKADIENLDPKSLYFFCVVFAAVGIFMFFFNMSVHSDAMAYLMGLFGAWMLALIALYRKTRNARHTVLGILHSITALMILFLVTGGQNGYSIIWLLLVPPISMYLNIYYGGFFSILLCVVTALYMWTPLHTVPFGYPYAQTWLTRFPITYFIETIICLEMQYRVWTYRKEHQELLEKEEKANHAKSDFLANMSHEIRTPMNAIMGMCELVLNEEGLSDDVRENCANIHLAGRNLLGIINDLLDFSKIESGKMELVCEPYQLDSMLNDIINMAMARKGDKQIEVIVDCDPNIPDKLYGDEIRIRQVIVNLLTNAIKFTREGGVLLRVRTRKESYGLNLIFTVKDSGIGIKKKNLSKLFRSFSQLDTRRNREIEGTGLGLAIAKQLVKQMGGMIHVDSVYGKGTEFTAVIPQKIVDEQPIINLPNRARVHFLCYIQFQKYSHPFVKKYYSEMIANLIHDFGVVGKMCLSLEEAKEALASGTTYTHLFLAREEYEPAQAYFDRLSEQMTVAVVQDRKNRIQVGGKIRSIYKPFYALSVGNVLNDEKLSFTIGNEKIKKGHFYAPKAKILVVDDNTMNLKVADGLLKPYGMTLLTAESGQEAIEMVRRSPDYHIIFMDHMMPGMDGVEAAHKIRELEGEYFQTVPIVALTANAVSGVREMFLKEGFQGFVAKPIEMSDMERTLRRLLPKGLIEHEEDAEGEGEA